MSNQDIQAQIQALYSDYQQAIQMAQVREDQKNALQSIIIEYRTIIETINELKESTPTSPSMLTLGEKVMIEVDLSQTSRVLIDIGNDLVVPFGYSEAEKYLETQIKRTQESLNSIREEFSKLQQAIAMMQSQLNSFQSQ